MVRPAPRARRDVIARPVLRRVNDSLGIYPLRMFPQGDANLWLVLTSGNITTFAEISIHGFPARPSVPAHLCAIP